MAVRNSWMTATADGRKTPVGLGPRQAGGWLGARLTLRTASGDISPEIEITAGGKWDGRSAHAYITVPAGMTVRTYVNADGSTALHITQDGAA